MVDRAQLIAYLLHEMPEEERADLAEQWFTGPELQEALQAAEAELLDGYARGELAPEQRRRVEEFLLGSQTQRDKLAFALAFRDALAPPLTARSRRWFGMAAAVVIAALAASTIWYARRAAHLSSLLEQAAAGRASQPLPGGIYEFAVSPDSSRGAAEQNRLKLPQGAEMLRFDFTFEQAEQAPEYSALLSHAGRTVWSEQGIRGFQPTASSGGRGQANVVPVWVPAKLLENGSYDLELRAGGRLLAYYSFRIT